MAENVLDIVTGVNRPTFTVDGTPCELRHPTELSMTEMRRLSSLGKELRELGENPSGETTEILDQIERKSGELLTLIAPDIPDAIVSKLNVFHILKIMQAFMALVPTGDSLDEPLTKVS